MNHPNLTGLPPWALGLVAQARVGHLGLLDDQDRPRVLPVTFAVAGDAVYSAVDHKPKSVAAQDLARVRFLRRRPEAALTVDTYHEDWSRLAWVQVLGRVEIGEPADWPEGIEALCRKYGQYREGRPGGPLLRLAPERCLCWRAAPSEARSA